MTQARVVVTSGIRGVGFEPTKAYATGGDA
jgi:hypothetical protein